MYSACDNFFSILKIWFLSKSMSLIYFLYLPSTKLSYVSRMSLKWYPKLKLRVCFLLTPQYPSIGMCVCVPKIHCSHTDPSYHFSSSCVVLRWPSVSHSFFPNRISCYTHVEHRILWQASLIKSDPKDIPVGLPHCLTHLKSDPSIS